jgi:hypothetical protein
MHRVDVVADCDLTARHGQSQDKRRLRRLVEAQVKR